MSEWEAGEGKHWAVNADRYTRQLAGFADIVTDAAGYRPGERVLDVGCGCGDLSLAAGRAVTATGEVLGLDLSPAMLGVSADLAASAGLDHVAFTVADAAAHRPDPAAFDVMVSRFGVMFFDDPTAAFTHLRSLMTPGGRLTFVCWQELFANDWMIVPGAAVAEVLALPEGGDPSGPGPFTFADPHRITTILTQAGFDGATAVAANTPLWLGDDAAEAAAFLRTTGLGRAVFADADLDRQEEAIRRVTAALRPYETEAGVHLDGAAWLVTATT